MQQQEIAITKEFQDCLALFKKYGGKQVTRIEREMRQLGHKGFSRRKLYNRYYRGKLELGWIDLYNWKEIVFDATAAATAAAASPGKKKPPLKNVFKTWLRRVSPEMTWDWPHQELLYRYLDRVTAGELKRLMIFMPPRHGKSELVTVRYAAKRLLDDPKMNIIVSSYNQRLADRFSRKIRSVVAQSLALDNLEKANVVPDGEASQKSAEPSNHTARKRRSPEEKVECASGRFQSQKIDCWANLNAKPVNSVAEWETGFGGGVRAVGAGAGITGYGANLVIIDDPIKSRAEAESKIIRDKVYNWFNDDISTRLEPNGAIILIQTRWHEDDLAGRLVKEMKNGGEQWEILSLPALAEEERETVKKGEEKSTCGNGGHDERAETRKPENSSPLLTVSPSPLLLRDPLGRAPGQALCPQRFDEEGLAKLRRKLGEYSFAALYQQRPVPLNGSIFKRNWFEKIVDRMPSGVRLVRAYDLAVSTATSADYTASALVGFDRPGNVYIADIMRRKLEFPEQRRFVLEKLKLEPHVEHGIELALHGQAIIQDLRRVPGIRSTALRGIRVTVDKVTRALAWSNLAEEGRLYLIRGPWNRNFVEEVLSFPLGEHDDQIDAVSLAIVMASRRPYRYAGF